VRYGDRAVALFPLRVAFYDAPVVAHQRRGEWHVAEQELRQALQFASEPEAPHLHVLLARLYEAAGRNTEARDELAWLLAHVPNDPDVAALKARLGAQPGQ
jgi:hypothetical protein